jgi:hypothetical protein
VFEYVRGLLRGYISSEEWRVFHGGYSDYVGICSPEHLVSGAADFLHHDECAWYVMMNRLSCDGLCVEYYRRLRREGYSGPPVVVRRDGVIIDGAHRIMAFLLSGGPVKCRVEVRDE